MLEHTRQSIHYGVGCVFTPQPVCDAGHALDFQQSLAEEGLSFTSTNTPPGAIVLIRSSPPLEIRVQQPGPALGSLAAIASGPQIAHLDVFKEEAEGTFEAFARVWEGSLQVIQREVTLRHLYDVADEHSFRFLWEQRLRRSEAELGAFGRRVLGGGLRFVIPPTAPESDEPNVEVKVESFLTNPKKLFVEVQLKWHRPVPYSEIDTATLLKDSDDYATNEVVAFISEGQED